MGKRNNDKCDRRKTSRKVPHNQIQVEINMSSQRQDIERNRYDKERKTPRKKPPDDVKVKVYSDYESACRLLDISEGGMKISSAFKFEVNDEVGIFCMLPGAGGINFICRVVWHLDNRADWGMSNHTGLEILKATKAEDFIAFVTSLPKAPVEKAQS